MMARFCSLCAAFGVCAGAVLLAAGAPYGSWKHGPPSGPDYFPIAVWLQDPANAPRFKQAGINLYIGLWQGPTEAQLAALKAAKMPVICDQNEVGLAHKDDPTIVGWMHGDEPDNAQPVTDPATGEQTYGGPVPPPKIVADYERMRAADSARPILLNLGQGVANDQWIGRGSGAHIDDYLTYVKGGDVISYDVYPVVGIGKENGANYLWYVAKGIARLIKWSKGEKIIWNCIECTHIGNEKAKATPQQVKAEVWMSLIHGSRGIIYFVHEFKPRFKEAALLEDPPMLEAVTAVNRQIRQLAPVLNSPTVKDGAAAQSSSADVPIAAMVKCHRNTTYLFTVGMRNAPATGSFKVKGLPRQAVAEVIGENRTLRLEKGRFKDSFRPYEVHLYRIRGGR
ncbi:MAG: hypothetical protein IT210_00225 [Armatimonadetes bacterium]|nr:hypothetical protein [Armatimonadota bacterium]